jgi:hypothetical protein
VVCESGHESVVVVISGQIGHEESRGVVRSRGGDGGSDGLLMVLVVMSGSLVLFAREEERGRMSFRSREDGWRNETGDERFARLETCGEWTRRARRDVWKEF